MALAKCQRQWKILEFRDGTTGLVHGSCLLMEVLALMGSPCCNCGMQKRWELKGRCLEGRQYSDTFLRLALMKEQSLCQNLLLLICTWTNLFGFNVDDSLLQMYVFLLVAGVLSSSGSWVSPLSQFVPTVILVAHTAWTWIGVHLYLFLPSSLGFTLDPTQWPPD